MELAASERWPTDESYGSIWSRDPWTLEPIESPYRADGSAPAGGSVLLDGHGAVSGRASGWVWDAEEQPAADGPLILVVPALLASLVPALAASAGAICNSVHDDDHAAIVARSLEIPIVQSPAAVCALSVGAPVSIDGDSGEIFRVGSLP